MQEDSEFISRYENVPVAQVIYQNFEKNGCIMSYCVYLNSHKSFLCHLKRHNISFDNEIRIKRSPRIPFTRF